MSKSILVATHIIIKNTKLQKRILKKNAIKQLQLIKSVNYF